MRRGRRWLLASTALTAAMALPMPAAADPVSITIAAVGAYAASVGASVAAGLALGVALTSTTALVAGLIGGVTAAAGQLLAPKPKVPEAAFSQQIASQQSAQPRRVVYGRARVAPDVPFSATTEGDRWLHLVHVLAGHECDGLEAIWFDDQQVWDPVNGFEGYSYNGGRLIQDPAYGSFERAKMTFHAGAEDQEADPDLVAAVPEWTAAHRGRGICWVYLRLWGDAFIFERGIPNVTYVVRGAKLHDPRTGVTQWSANPALVINDWVLNSRYGYRESQKFWDEAAVIAAANIADEQVPLAEGGTEPRYVFGGAFRTDADKEDVLRAMLTSCAGQVPREGPRRRLLVGAWRTPLVELSDDDLAGKVEITVGRPKAETFLAVRGRFQSPEADYILDEYPEVVAAAHDPAQGDPKAFGLDLPFTPSAATAQRLAKLTLLAQSQRIVASASWKLKALRLRAGDTFLWTSARYGWDAKPFEVTDRALVVEGAPPVMRIALTARETGPAVHDWTASDQQPYLAGTPTQLPDPYRVEPPGLSLSDEVRIVAEQLVAVLVATPTSSSGNAAGYEVQARRAGTLEPVNLGRGPSGAFELPFVAEGEAYEARARVITHVGAASDWSGWAAHVVRGKAAPPGDVAQFRLELVDGMAHLAWAPVADPDLSHYRIRHAPLTVGASYGDAIDVAPKVARPATSVTLPWQEGTWFIVAVDKSGHRSVNPTALVATGPGPAGLNAVETVEDAAPFAGTHDRTLEEAGALRLVREELPPFFDAIAEIDAAPDWDAIGLGERVAEGTYELPGPLDLGAVYTSRLAAAVTSARIEDGVGLDGVLEVDAVEAWDAIGAGASAAGDVNVALEVATTLDDPAGAPAWAPWAAFRTGDLRARAVRFRLRLTSANGAATPSVSAVRISIDMPDRILTGQDIATGAGPFAVAFMPPFRALKALAITGQDLTSGDYWEITAKSAAGFTITFRNAAGAAVGRSFDYQAIGYGDAA